MPPLKLKSHRRLRSSRKVQKHLQKLLKRLRQSMLLRVSMRLLKELGVVYLLWAALGLSMAEAIAGAILGLTGLIGLTTGGVLTVDMVATRGVIPVTGAVLTAATRGVSMEGVIEYIHTPHIKINHHWCQ